MTCQENGDIVDMSTKWRDNMDEIRKNISIIYRQLNLFLNHELEGINITAMELMYLSSLYQNDGVTQDDLVQEYCIDKAATARAIQGMEKKGLVTRRTSSTDNRAKIVCLTQKAITYIAFIRQIQQKWIDELKKELTEEEMRTFTHVLSVVTQKAKQINQTKNIEEYDNYEHKQKTQYVGS